MSGHKASGQAARGSGQTRNTDAGLKRTARTKTGGARAKRSRLGRAIDQVTANPFAAVFGVAAVSAGLALLLPSSERESEVMGEVADKLGDVARDAADSVVAAGRAQVETLAQTALAGVGGAVLQAVASSAEASGGED